MAKRHVGSRELKTRLGSYLHRVRMGETIIVTDHAEPIAELRPVGGGDSMASRLARLAAQGLVTLPARRAAAAVTAARVPKGASGAAAVTTDRDARG